MVDDEITTSQSDDKNATSDEATSPVAPLLSTPSSRPNRRKVREGTVISHAMTKTAVVSVIDRVRDRRYGKTVQRTKRFYVHDEEGLAAVGDRVLIAETRPISKLKRWRLVEVTEHAR
jgi:small subunit ribosomal protein S17